MSKTVTISDALATLLEERRSGDLTLDDVAETLIARGLTADRDEDHSAGRTDAELRALLEAGEASGPATAWDGAADKAEILRRYAARHGG